MHTHMHMVAVAVAVFALSGGYASSCTLADGPFVHGTCVDACMSV